MQPWPLVILICLALIAGLVALSDDAAHILARAITWAFRRRS